MYIKIFAGVIFLLSCVMLLKCQSSNVNANIVPLSPYEEVVNLRVKVLKTKFYLVENFDSDRKQQFLDIKKFAFDHLDSDLAKFSVYSIFFIKLLPKPQRILSKAETI